MRYMPNKYAGVCVDCQQTVAAGAGRTWKAGGRWQVSHGGQCAHVAAQPLTFKQRYGHCEDAPCCGCCGGGQDYMTGEQMHDLFGDDF